MGRSTMKASDFYTRASLEFGEHEIADGSLLGVLLKLDAIDSEQRKGHTVTSQALGILDVETATKLLQTYQTSSYGS